MSDGADEVEAPEESSGADEETGAEEEPTDAEQEPTDAEEETAGQEQPEGESEQADEAAGAEAADADTEDEAAGLQDGDFVRIAYTARTVEGDQLVDTTETAAREQLDALGLIPSIDRQNMLTSPEGTVIGQDPPAGNEVRRGSEVGLIVSAGPSTVEMIDVTGMSLAEARSRLQAAPLHLSIARVDRVYSDTVDEGDVIAQSVRGGEDIEQGSDVVLQVSRGVQQVEVPDVAGMTRSEAEQALADAGLTLDVSREYSDTVPSAGEVIEQSVEPGTKLDIDSSVEVVVSAGPRTIDLPNVRGDALQSAVDQLRELDLRVQVIREPRQRIGPFVRGEEGLVEETAPPPGSSIQRQERVKLYTFDDDAEE
ncbi:MAG: hypothetical protein BRC32_00275 [Actinobacteria bacterium QS_8_72_14]|nr:MAG: hypothetical protein BRC32_00275 [Actinobacteria bacterium QS_8_72_14]